MKITTHCYFDKGMNNLPSDQLLRGFQQFTQFNEDDSFANNTDEISASNLEFFVYLFTHTLPSDKYRIFDLNLASNKLSGILFVRKLIDKSSGNQAHT